jgi:CubicO group peptidase (beta-lactamase class C family)
MHQLQIALGAMCIALVASRAADAVEDTSTDEARVARQIGALCESGPLDAEELDRVIRAGMVDCSIPGLSIAVIQDAEIVYSNAFGLKNATTTEPVTEATLFEACSLTKPVFALAVNRLVDRGVIDLDKPLYEYHAESSHVADVRADERLQLITGRHVLAHRTGFPNWRDKKLTIVFTPGSQFGYSGEGFEYLGQIVSHMTKKRVNEVLRDEVFVPLGIVGAHAICNQEIAKLSATGHDGTQPLPKWMPSEPLMAASLHISANDYAKFLVAILNRSGMSEEQFKKMLQPQFVDREGSNERPYCLGMPMQQTPYGRKYSHSGRNSGGFSCYFAIYDEKKFGYVFFVNNWRASDFNEILEAYLVSGMSDKGAADNLEQSP